MDADSPDNFIDCGNSSVKPLGGNLGFGLKLGANLFAIVPNFVLVDTKLPTYGKTISSEERTRGDHSCHNEGTTAASPVSARRVCWIVHTSRAFDFLTIALYGRVVCHKLDR